jgi:hypothetical protein
MEVEHGKHAGDPEEDGGEKCDGRHSSEPSTLGQGANGSLVASMAGVSRHSLNWSAMESSSAGHSQARTAMGRLVNIARMVATDQWISNEQIRHYCHSKTGGVYLSPVKAKLSSTNRSDGDFGGRVGGLHMQAFSVQSFNGSR